MSASSTHAEWQKLKHKSYVDDNYLQSIRLGNGAARLSMQLQQLVGQLHHFIITTSRLHLFAVQHHRLHLIQLLL